MKLEGKTALVAGGGRGIGRAISLALAREGAQVAVADILKENAEAVRAEIQGIGQKALALQVDLTKKAEVDQAVGDELQHFDLTCCWILAELPRDLRRERNDRAVPA